MTRVWQSSGAGLRGAGLLLVLVLVLAGCMPAQQTAVADFVALDGSPVKRSDFAGRWLLVNYWAEWCAPCRVEIPELNALDAERDDIRVVGVNFDFLEAAELARAADRFGIGFLVLRDDPSSAFGFDLPEVLPTTVIVDPQGRVVRTLQGPQTRESLLAAIDGGG